jgi:hypothetical protein
MDEQKLIERLRLVEALHAGATTPGEKVAAERARERIIERLKLWEQTDPPVEYRFGMSDMWSRKVFVALLRRYDITPYRYTGQRYTTVMARISRRFVDETLWPEFLDISKSLRAYLAEVTDRVVAEVIHRDSSDAEVVEKPKEIPLIVEADRVGGESGQIASNSATEDEQPTAQQGSQSDQRGSARQKRKQRKRRGRR